MCYFGIDCHIIILVFAVANEVGKLIKAKTVVPRVDGLIVRCGVIVSRAKESRSLLHHRGKFLDSNSSGCKDHNYV